MLTRTYQPKTLKDIVGQNTTPIEHFLTDFPKSKALLLHGPSGTGKTSSAMAAARDYELIEINASDVRNKDGILQTIGQAINQQSLFGKQKLILIDEIDGLSGQKDRGGLPTILTLIQKSTYPIILTCIDPYDNKYSKLRKQCSLVEYNKLDPTAITTHLTTICDQERIPYETSALKQLARQAGGDMRGALFDLQSLMGRGKITMQLLEDVGLRQQQTTITAALQIILKTTNLQIAIKAFDNVPEDQDQQLLWLDNNIPKEYTKQQDLANAYRMLSHADIYRRRIRRWQHWRFMVYINSFLTAGVASAKQEKYATQIPYKPTGRLLKIWWANRKQQKKKAIAHKVAGKTHTSTKRALQTVPMLQNVFKHNTTMAAHLSTYLELDKEEITWLKT